MSHLENIMDLIRYKYPDLSEEEVKEKSEKVEARRKWLVNHQGKTCSGCQKFKSLSEYGTDSREQDGLHTRCKECRGTNERRT